MSLSLELQNTHSADSDKKLEMPGNYVLKLPIFRHSLHQVLLELPNCFDKSVIVCASASVTRAEMPKNLSFTIQAFFMRSKDKTLDT